MSFLSKLLVTFLKWKEIRKTALNNCKENSCGCD